MKTHPVLVATSNAGKVRDFEEAAATHGISVAILPEFDSLEEVVEDGQTFEQNARKKAEAYSKAAPQELVIADDSGLEIDALNGAPGIYSARYAYGDHSNRGEEKDSAAKDSANNAKVMREMVSIPPERRTARFVCVIAAARDGRTLESFRGTVEGFILEAPRGHNGFGYDPLFYFPQIGKTLAELTPHAKAQFSHRGEAFRAFLHWYRKTSA